MATSPVRKFAISIDPDEVLGFEEPLSYFEEVFQSIGFEPAGTYRFRYADRECTMTADLSTVRDGFELWMLVQAPDEHEFRLHEVADAFTGFIIAASGTKAYVAGTYRHRAGY